MRKNGKKPGAALMAERALEEDKKANATEMLGPQELPGPSDGPSKEEISAAIAGALDSGPMAFDDLVLWTRKRFGVSMEVADGLVQGEITMGGVQRGETRCYTAVALEHSIRELLKDGERTQNAVAGDLDFEIGADEGSPASHHIDSAIDGMVELKTVIRRIDGEPFLCLVPEAVKIAEAIAEVASNRPDLVEGAGTPETDAKEAHDDARDLRQDSKKLVSVMSLLRRRKALRDLLKSAKQEAKEYSDELKDLDAQLEGMGNDERNIEPAPKPASGEPEDVELPFTEDEQIDVVDEEQEETSEASETPVADGAPAAALVG